MGSDLIGWELIQLQAKMTLGGRGWEDFTLHFENHKSFSLFSWTFTLLDTIIWFQFPVPSRERKATERTRMWDIWNEAFSDTSISWTPFGLRTWAGDKGTEVQTQMHARVFPTQESPKISQTFGSSWRIFINTVFPKLCFTEFLVIGAKGEKNHSGFHKLLGRKSDTLIIRTVPFETHAWGTWSAQRVKVLAL